MGSRERISGVDTAWLRMEQPANLMMIVGVMALDGPIAIAALQRVISTRFLSYPRFRCRAVQEPSGTWWERDAALDLDHHVKVARLPAPAGKRELETLVSELASTPLDPARPLWQFHLVERYGRGSAVVVRIHHCYADGIALVQVILSLTGATARASRAAPKPGEREPAEAPGAWERLAGSWTEAAQLGRTLLEQGRDIAGRPLAAAGAAQEAARKGVELAAEIAHLALMGRDARTRFKGPLGRRKRVAWDERLALDEVRAVGKALGCSINDVLMATAAGALREYLREKRDAVEGVEIRAVVPVNLRGNTDARGLGNHFGLVFVELPLGIDHPLERLHEMRRRMSALKGSFQPAIALALLNAVGSGPRALQELVTQLLGSSATAVITNVPGPRQPLYLAGRQVAALDCWVPQSGGIGMGLSILSYDGRIQFGVMTDERLVPDPARIVELFAAEFEKLMWLTLLSPWAP